MNNKPKEETVRIVIVGVPKSHIRILRIASAEAGNKYLSPLMRDLIAEWTEKWESNREVQ